MIFKGQRWTVCRTVVIFPHQLWHGEHKNYVMFGKIVPHNTPGAVKTDSFYRNSLPQKLWGGDTSPPPDGQKDEEDFWYVYVLPVKNEGHSLTNLMYAPRGYAYLAYDGRVYVRRSS